MFTFDHPFWSLSPLFLFVLSLKRHCGVYSSRRKTMNERRERREIER